MQYLTLIVFCINVPLDTLETPYRRINIMRVSELPKKTTLLGEAYDEKTLEAFLEEVTGGGDSAFTHTEPVHGSDRSIQVFFREAYGTATRLPFPYAAGYTAGLLLELSHSKARYREPDSSRQRKGWEVRRAEIGEQSVAIVFAKWV